MYSELGFKWLKTSGKSFVDTECRKNSLNRINPHLQNILLNDWPVLTVNEKSMRDRDWGTVQSKRD